MFLACVILTEPQLVSHIQFAQPPSYSPNKLAQQLIAVMVVLYTNNKARLAVWNLWELGQCGEFTFGDNECGSY